MDAPPTHDVFSRTSAIFSALCAGIGGLALGGWCTGDLVLCSAGRAFIPMAPTTAAALVLAGLILLVPHGSKALGRVASRAALVLLALVLGLSLAHLAAPSALSGGPMGVATLWSTPGGRLVPLRVMSPLTLAVLFVALGALGALQVRGRSAQLLRVALGGVVGWVGLVVLLGYLSGMPLLYNSAQIPVALTTGLGLAAMGTGLLTAGGRASPALAPFLGEATQARLLRAFLPASLLAVLLAGALALFAAELSSSPALLLATVLAVAMTAAGGVIAALCRQLAVELERSRKEREHAEGQSRAAEEAARLLMERSSEPALVHRRGVLLAANQALLDVLGFGAQAELLGRNLLELVHPEDHPDVIARMKATAEAHSTFPGEVRVLRADGKALLLEVVGLPILFQGEPAAVVLMRNVTARAEITARLMQMDRLLAVGTLAAGVGHEINNPLAYVTSNLSFALCELDKLPKGLWRSLEEVAQALGEAAEGSERIRQIVRDLKTFARGEVDQTGPVELWEVMESAIKMAGPEIRHRAQLVRAYAPTPPVSANAARLCQVFLNLLVNAAHAIPEGAVARNEIRLRTFVEGERVVAEVEDTGVGIPKENQKRIFDPFFTTKPVGQGTGLGLSICQGIIRSYSGELSVRSEPGRGATFRVDLPAAARPAESAPPGSAVLHLVPAPGRARILCIDDEPLVLGALRRNLAREHEVVTLSNAREALARLSMGERFDVVLCDLMMPDLSGMDLHAELSQSAPEAAARMVFLTGGVFTDRAREFLQRVPNERLDKPVDLQRLREIIARRLKRPAA